MSYNISPRGMMDLSERLREEINEAATRIAAGKNMMTIRCEEINGYEYILVHECTADEVYEYTQKNPSSDWVYYWPEEFLAQSATTSPASAGQN